VWVPGRIENGRRTEHNSWAATDASRGVRVGSKRRGTPFDWSDRKQEICIPRSLDDLMKHDEYTNRCSLRSLR